MLHRYDVPVPRYTSYPTAPMWTSAVGPRDHAGALSAAQPPLSLYVHIPFCKERCAFCGCNVVVARSTTTADRYVSSVLAEMDLVLNELGDRRQVSQIHWGGGTPTFLSERQLEALWLGIARRFAIGAGTEIAIEIDPRVTSRDQLALLRSFGFNRVSIGVQDLNDEVQTAIGRGQTVEQTRATLDAARELGFESISFDLVYGLPMQTLASWRRTLARVIAMRPDRIATYAFAHVPDARPNQSRLPLAGIPQGERKLELFRTASDALIAAGWKPIGMDHFALPHDSLARAGWLTRNFQGYTLKAANDLVGLGVSAISDVAAVYTQNTRSLSRYESAIAQGQLATERGFALTADDRERRRIIIGLMCNGRVEVSPRFGAELERLRPLERDGLVELHGNAIAVTPLGWRFVRNVASIFDAYLTDESRPFSRAV